MECLYGAHTALYLAWNTHFAVGVSTHQCVIVQFFHNAVFYLVPTKVLHTPTHDLHINLELKLQNTKTQHATSSHHIMNTLPLCTAIQDILPSPMTQLSSLPLTISHFHVISWCPSDYSHFCRIPLHKRWKPPAFVPGFLVSEILSLHFFLHRRGENMQFYYKSFLC